MSGKMLKKKPKVSADVARLRQLKGLFKQIDAEIVHCTNRSFASPYDRASWGREISALKRIKNRCTDEMQTLKARINSLAFAHGI